MRKIPRDSFPLAVTFDGGRRVRYKHTKACIKHQQCSFSANCARTWSIPTNFPCIGTDVLYSSVPHTGNVWMQYGDDGISSSVQHSR